LCASQIQLNKMLPGFHQSELCQPSGELHQLHGQPEARHKRLGDLKDPTAARKVQKADREKLRRDRLNEQFAELGSALDPDRPKNDKATILGDTIQILKDLSAEVKRLKCEEKSLVEESHDITQEKNELREEKTVLKAEIDHLRSQFEQRVRTMFSWTAMDPTMMVGAPPPFPYSMPIPHPGTNAVPNSHSIPLQGHAQTPLMPASFVPVPVPPGTIPMHPPFQAYPFFGTRSSEGTNPYLAFPPYTSPVNTHTHVERPAAQYPSPIQPLPGYLVQLQLSQGNRLGSDQPKSTSSVSQSADAPILAQASDGTSEYYQGDKSTVSIRPLNQGTNNAHKPSPSHSGSRSDHLDSKHIDLQLKIQGSSPNDSHPQSDHSTHSSEEQEQIQEASSEVKKGKSSSLDRSPVPLGLQLIEKSCSGHSSP
ncbi:hypothetical protein KI387_035449, partial [Taxus chinensis]